MLIGDLTQAKILIFNTTLVRNYISKVPHVDKTA